MMEYRRNKNLYTGSIDNLPTTSGVYLQVCTENDYKYVGKAQNMRKRAKEEIKDMEMNDIDKVKNKKMKIDFDKYGKDCFEYYVIQECSENLSIYLEDFYIRTYDTIKKGYNSRHGDLNSLNKKHFSSEDKYFLSNIETVGKEYDWIIKKIDLEVFDKTLWRNCTLNNYINEFKVIINRYVTVDMILEVLIKFEFPVFIYNSLGDFYYEITAKEFKDLYNDEYSYSNKLIEDELKRITFGRNLKDVHVGTYKYNKTDKFIEFVETYNDDIYQEICKIDNEIRSLEYDIKEKATQLKKLIEYTTNEKILKNYMDSYYNEIGKLGGKKEEKNKIGCKKLDELIINKYNLGSLNVFKRMHTIIELKSKESKNDSSSFSV